MRSTSERLEEYYFREIKRNMADAKRLQSKNDVKYIYCLRKAKRLLSEFISFVN